MSFIQDCLTPILQDDVSEEIVNYILTISSKEDYDDFMNNIVDRSQKAHIKAYEDLKNHLFGNKTNKKKKSAKSSGSQQQQLQQNQQQLQPQKNGTLENNSGKGKKKFTNFYNYDNAAGLRSGRHPCNCQATKHELINNCTKCGRIVCRQEGSGPCLFCDNMVCTKQEMELLNAKTKESDRFYNHLIEQKKSKEFKKAIENRNRLLETDQMGVVKNKVFDDQNDYFDINSKWIDESEREKLKKKYRGGREILHRSRRDLKIALDFASRTVILDDEVQGKQKENLLKGVNKLLDNTDRRFPRNLFDGDKGKLITEIVKLMDETKINSNKNNTKGNKFEKAATPAANRFRAANAEFLEAIDQGMCLSMHQPWATLLVAGIKIHEGRTWRTEHRGRLWIAAAAKEPEDEEILSCEEMYRAIYNDPGLEFPKKYPTGCLLGCVFVEDCLDQNTYRERYPDGESGSPFVLICSSPVILPIFYPMQGQHKIFPINKELHRTAKAALMSSKWV